ncbi:MAG: hypothetical protein IPJ01_11000 [Micavibrio sp.]|nr:hypothetical protein [Micavibrio sp.]
MKKKKHLPQSIGVLFIRWNLQNRVSVAVAYFEEGEMVYMTIDKNKMLKLCSNFLPKDVTYEFISDYPIAMKKQKTNEAFWNEMAIQQNGILELNKVSPISIKLNRKDFNNYAKLYLK